MCFDNCKKIFKLDGILEKHGNLLFIFSIILLAIELFLAASIVTENIIHQPLVGVNQANIHVFSFPYVQLCISYQEASTALPKLVSRNMLN